MPAKTPRAVGRPLVDREPAPGPSPRTASLAVAPWVKGVHLTQGADSQDRFSQETGEAVMACARFGRYLHRRSGPTDSRLPSRQDVPVEPARSTRTGGSTPHGVLDLLRRECLLGPALTCPGLAAFHSGHPGRCGWSEGLKRLAPQTRPGPLRKAVKERARALSPPDSSPVNRAGARHGTSSPAEGSSACSLAWHLSKCPRREPAPGRSRGPRAGGAWGSARHVGH